MKWYKLIRIKDNAILGSGLTYEAAKSLQYEFILKKVLTQIVEE